MACLPETERLSQARTAYVKVRDLVRAKRKSQYEEFERKLFKCDRASTLVDTAIVQSLDVLTYFIRRDDGGKYTIPKEVPAKAPRRDNMEPGEVYQDSSESLDRALSLLAELHESGSLDTKKLEGVTRIITDVQERLADAMEEDEDWQGLLRAVPNKESEAHEVKCSEGQKASKVIVSLQQISGQNSECFYRALLWIFWALEGMSVELVAGGLQDDSIQDMRMFIAKLAQEMPDEFKDRFEATDDVAVHALTGRIGGFEELTLFAKSRGILIKVVLPYAKHPCIVDVGNPQAEKIFFITYEGSVDEGKTAIPVESGHYNIFVKGNGAEKSCLFKSDAADELAEVHTQANNLHILRSSGYFAQKLREKNKQAARAKEVLDLTQAQVTVELSGCPGRPSRIQESLMNAGCTMEGLHGAIPGAPKHSLGLGPRRLVFESRPLAIKFVNEVSKLRGLNPRLRTQVVETVQDSSDEKDASTRVTDPTLRQKAFEDQVCAHFLRGDCLFGDNCRNKHECEVHGTECLNADGECETLASHRLSRNVVGCDSVCQSFIECM